jgi:hypothetical protein
MSAFWIVWPRGTFKRPHFRCTSDITVVGISLIKNAQIENAVLCLRISCFIVSNAQIGQGGVYLRILTKSKGTSSAPNCSSQMVPLRFPIIISQSRIDALASISSTPQRLHIYHSPSSIHAIRLRMCSREKRR